MRRGCNAVVSNWAGSHVCPNLAKWLLKGAWWCDEHVPVTPTSYLANATRVLQETRATLEILATSPAGPPGDPVEVAKIDSTKQAIQILVQMVDATLTHIKET